MVAVVPRPHVQIAGVRRHLRQRGLIPFHDGPHRLSDRLQWISTHASIMPAG